MSSSSLFFDFDLMVYEIEDKVDFGMNEPGPGDYAFVFGNIPNYSIF